MEKRGKGDMKRKKGFLSRIFAHHMRLITAILVVIGLSTALLYKRSTYAVSDSGKKAIGVVGGATAGGLIIGFATKAKFAPLGIVGGAIVGGLIARNAIRRHRERRAAAEASYEQQTPRSRRRGRSHTKNMMNGYMVPPANQPYPSYNYVNQRNTTEFY